MPKCAPHTRTQWLRCSANGWSSRIIDRL